MGLKPLFVPIRDGTWRFPGMSWRDTGVLETYWLYNMKNLILFWLSSLLAESIILAWTPARSRSGLHPAPRVPAFPLAFDFRGEGGVGSQRKCRSDQIWDDIHQRYIRLNQKQISIKFFEIIMKTNNLFIGNKLFEIRLKIWGKLKLGRLSILIMQRLFHFLIFDVRFSNNVEWPVANIVIHSAEVFANNANGNHLNTS